MALLQIRDLHIAFDDPPLLDRVSLTIERGERVCLVGRNGTGKSTLLRVIAGNMLPDAGEIAHERGTTVTDLPQEVPQDLRGTVFDVVAQGLREQRELLTRYHDVSERLAHKHEEALLSELEAITHEIELSGGWHIHHEIGRVLTHMGLDPHAECAALSAGMKRRVLLARALVSKPDLLLLDEPTNHLDIATIQWLEEYLEHLQCALLFVTHDRAFVRKLSTRVVELDRGELRSFSCDYDTYLVRKEEFLQVEAKQRAQFEKRLAEEEAWLRKGIRARRTRNEGRVRALMRMREYKRSLRQRIGSIHLEAQEASRTGKLVIEIENAHFTYGDHVIVQDFSTTIMRGDKIGIIGANGSGKTTLLNLLLGRLALLGGTLSHGTNLEIAYFDQLRSQLLEEKTVQENVGEGRVMLTINGRQRHVIGYLEDFLFPPERSRSPVSILSGGERNRLLLAKLFTLPSNVLVLDEPTNDLDAETLDLLEEMLVQYQGTVLLVSHDRAFLNNVVTSTIALEGNGEVQEYIGGYDDYLRQSSAAVSDRAPSRMTEQSKGLSSEKRPETNRAQSTKKLGFNEQRELDGLPDRIASLEGEKATLLSSLADAQIYSDGGEVERRMTRIEEIEIELRTAYDRWAELEERTSKA